MSDLPAGWIETTIGDITIGIEQRAPLPDDEFFYIDISSINRDTKQITAPQKLTGSIAPSRARQLVRSGDTLVSMTRPNLNAVAIVPNDFDGQIASTGFNVLRANNIDPRWLYFLVRTDAFVSAMSDLVQGALYPAIRPRDISNYSIPLAPLSEQKRIADKLDRLLVRVDACQVHLERVPEILKRFRQSVLAAATSGKLTEEWRALNGYFNNGTTGFDFLDADCFGDYEFPATWKPLRLQDIADVIGGITKDSKKQSPLDEEIPYLRVANVQRGYLDLSEMKTIRVPKQRVDNWLLKPGDILFNEGGDIDKLGRGWIWNGEIERCIFQNHVFRARLQESSFVPRYFSYYGNSRGYDYFLRYGKQTTNLASINKRIIDALPIAVPPVDEQQEIVRRVDGLFAHANRLEARWRVAQAQVNRLTPAMLAKAFRGELVEQDINDEPAEKLLERIKMQRATQPVDKPSRQPQTQKTRETKMTEESVKAVIAQFPEETFSFDELREKLPGDYEQLKSFVFTLLAEPDAIIAQVFDQSAKTMHFVRRMP